MPPVQSLLEALAHAEKGAVESIPISYHSSKPMSNLPPSADILIRAARAEDVPVLQRLEQESETAAHWSAAEYQKLFQPGAAVRRVWIISAAGEFGSEQSPESVVGFLVARPVGPEWEIENIVISPRARRRGLGSALLRHFLAEAAGQGAAAVHLEVRESNAPARRLYVSCGAVENGRRKAYYRRPEEDAITYVIRLLQSG